MSPDYLDYMTDEETQREYGSHPQKQLSWLYKEPITVDMEDILSVHEDEDFDNNLRATLAGSEREYIRPQMPDSNPSYSNYSLQANDVSQSDEFLQALNNNQQNIAGRLRFAYLTDDEAITRRMDIFVLKRLRQIKDKVEQIYQSGKGNKSCVKHAILNGRGNADSNYVPFVDSVNSYANYTSGYSIWNTLYRAVGSSGISTTELITVIAGTLEQIVGLFSHDMEAETAFQRNYDLKEAGDRLKNFFRPEVPDGSATRDLGELYVPKSLANDPEQRGPIQKATDWISDNPGKCLLIAAALIGGGIFIKRSLDGKTPASREANRPPVSRSGERPDTRKAPSKKVKFEELV
jgi:hypothetical protein